MIASERLYMHSVNNYIYKTVNDRQLCLSIYRKESCPSTPQPLILIFKGGAWKYKIITEIPEFYKEITKKLINQGFAIGVFEYRTCLVDNVYFPQIMQDCRDVISYIHHNRKKLGINTDEILFFGHSAGGQLAYMLSYGPDEYNISSLNLDLDTTALVLTNVPFYLYAADIGQGCISKEVSYIFEQSNMEKLKEISPIECISNINKPTMIICSEKDGVYSNLQAIQFIDKCKKENKKCEYIWLTGLDHDFNPVSNKEELARMEKAVLDFVEQNRLKKINKTL